MIKFKFFLGNNIVTILHISSVKLYPDVCDLLDEVQSLELPGV